MLVAETVGARVTRTSSALWRYSESISAKDVPGSASSASLLEIGAHGSPSAAAAAAAR
jgi:hypothetical protein